jgi:putative thioredoxin
MGFEITDFSRDVLDRSREIPVVVDFWAEWCAPCRVLGPILEKLAAKNAGRWVLAKVNTEEHQDIAVQYKIGSIPDVKLFIDGAVVDGFLGALPEYAIVKWLKNAIPGESDDRIAESLDLLNSGRTDDAAFILEQVLEAEPENEEAKVLLGRAIVFTDPGRAESLCAGIDVTNELYGTAEALLQYARLFGKRNAPGLLAEAPVKTLYLDAIDSLARQDYDSALEKMIRVMGEDRAYDDDGARKTCIAVFHFLGEEHEITKKHRHAFGMVLNA